MSDIKVSGEHLDYLESEAERCHELEQRIAELEAHLERAELERDEWRTKALDVEKHPVVVALRRERDEERARSKRLDSVLLRVRDLLGHSVAGWAGVQIDWPAEIAAIDAARKAQP